MSATTSKVLLWVLPLLLLGALAKGQSTPMVRLKVCEDVTDETLESMYGAGADRTFWIAPASVLSIGPGAGSKNCSRINMTNGRTINVHGAPKDVYCDIFKNPLCEDLK